MIKHKDEITRLASGFDLSCLLDLKKTSLALSFVGAQYNATRSQSRERIAELASFLASTRDQLISVIRALAKHRLFRDDFLENIKGSTGYSKTAWGVLALVKPLYGSWERLEGKVPLVKADLDLAESKAYEMISYLAAEKDGNKDVRVISDRRKRFFTLFIRDYDQVRRVVTFLRWNEGDAEELAPSLRQGQGGRKKIGASGSTAAEHDAAADDERAAGALGPATSIGLLGTGGASPHGSNHE